MGLAVDRRAAEFACGSDFRDQLTNGVTYLINIPDMLKCRDERVAAESLVQEKEEMILQKVQLLGGRALLVAVLSVVMAVAIACGSADTAEEVTTDGAVGGDDGAAPAAAVEDTMTGPPGVEIVATDVTFTVDDLVNTKNFKKSKEYKVEGLEGATAAIYGFFGPDPYDRQEFEARFYPDHETAMTLGVDFADESTGPDAVIAKDLQRWDEGLTQRRECQGNVRGSHHSGKCDNAKYGDYVIAGNLVLLCQGKDSETSLANCNALMDALQAQ